jgi:hypothetical protein
MPSHAFHDLPAELFPLTMRFFRESDGAEVWTIHVEGPAAVRIPPLAQEHGRVRVRVEFADGSVEE